MLRRNGLIPASAAATMLWAGASAWAGGAGVDAESGPIVNMASGQVIEVPEVAQPGDAPRRAEAAGAMVGSKPIVAKPSGTEGRTLGPSKAGAKTTGASGRGERAGAERESGGDSWMGHWTVRTALGLALLGGMLWGLKWSAKKFGAGMGLAGQLGPGGRSPQGLIEVLGRYPVSRGHSLVLLKLDRRVLLLGQSPTGFTTLSEMTDAEDVASVLTKAADADGASMSRRFSELLRGMERDASLVEDESGGAGAGVTTPRLAMRLAGGVGRGGGA